jgi:hypothetical protein
VKVALIVAAAACCTAAPSAAAAVPPLALTVSPARLTLVAPASRVIVLRNAGAQRVVVGVRRRSLGAAASSSWLSIRPTQVVLSAGATAVLTVRARRTSKATPGDHQLRLLFSAQVVGGGRVTVRLRLGVGLRIRVRGRIVRLVEIRGLRVRKRSSGRGLLVTVANRGNVTEQLQGRVSVRLFDGGRLVSRLRLRGLRELFPGSRAVIAMRYAGHKRGLVTAIVTVDLGRGVRRVERRFHLRL